MKVFTATKNCACCGKEFALSAPCQRYCPPCALIKKVEAKQESRRKAVAKLIAKAELFAVRHGLVPSDPTSFEFTTKNWSGETRWKFRGQKPSWRR